MHSPTTSICSLNLILLLPKKRSRQDGFLFLDRIIALHLLGLKVTWALHKGHCARPGRIRPLYLAQQWTLHRLVKDGVPRLGQNCVKVSCAVIWSESELFIILSLLWIGVTQFSIVQGTCHERKWVGSDSWGDWPVLQRTLWGPLLEFHQAKCFSWIQVGQDVPDVFWF